MKLKVTEDELRKIVGECVKEEASIMLSRLATIAVAWEEFVVTAWDGRHCPICRLEYGHKQACCWPEFFETMERETAYGKEKA